MHRLFQSDYIENYTKEKKLRKSDFEINRPQTLFGPEWENLQELRCPFCRRKLSEMKQGGYICRGTKHKKRFVISTEKLNELTAE